MFMRKVIRAVLTLALLCGVAFGADEYKIDPHHSQIGFAVTHMVVSTVNGRFGDFEGNIVFDEKDPSKSSVKVSIKSASITTDNNDRDTHLRSPDFLDAQGHPTITFQSKSVEEKGENYIAH